MTGLKARFRSEFVPEWCALGVLLAADVLWARAIGLHIAMARGDFLLPGAAVAVLAAVQLLAWTRGALMAEYFTLTLAATGLFGVLSYLALASSGPMIDTRLLAMDRALGFDWMAGYNFLKTHLLVQRVLAFAYCSLVYQGLYFCVLLGLMNHKDRIREMFWLILLGGLMTSLGAMLFPAFGPFKMFVAPAGSFLPEMARLKSGHDLNFALAHMTGVVSFPSFHTVMALAYVYGFRKTGIVGWGIAALNVLMLVSVPWFGGHYLMDMIAGSFTLLLSLALVRTAPALWKRFITPIPVLQKA
jgi:hypothetical protein